MKADTIAAFVALAATIQSVAATGVNWHHASPFKCPTKAPEICVPKQQSGLDWLELAEGKFEQYGGFKFQGFDCKNSFGGFKRDAILPRSFNRKCATAEVSADKKKCPKISAKDVKAFSITKFQVSVEFDCELEFHYTLPNKSICKQKSRCKKSGTVVENTQCGGATDVTIIYPKPPAKNKKTCKIGLHKIDFSCGPKKPNVPSVPASTIPTLPDSPSVTAPPADTTTSENPEETPADSTTSESPEETPADSTTSESPEETPADSTTTSENPEETPADSTTSESPEETPADSTTSESPEETPADSTTTSENPEETPADSTTSESPEETPADSTTTSENPEETPAVSETPEETPVDSTTAPENPEETPAPPAESKPPQETHVLTVIVTDSVSTTICPVTSTAFLNGTTSIDVVLSTSTVHITETQTITSCAGGCTGKPKPTKDVATTVEENSPGATETPKTETPGTETPETPETETPETETPGTETPETPETETPETETPETETPEEEQPEAETPEGECPPVLPKCLNTWLPEDCASNSDSNCFCPKPDFTKNLYECLAAHGAKQTEIDAAVQYFQGLCAPFVPTNPGIIVDTPERDEDDNTPVKIPEVPVTTIVLETIITVPCTPEAGEVTTSSTVSTVKTTVTAPQVIFTTVTGGEVTPVPGTATTGPAAIATPNNDIPSATQPAQEVPPFPTGPVTAPAAIPTAPAVPNTPENPSEEGPEGQTPCLGGGPECPGNGVPPPAPTTFVPLPVGTTPGSVGTVTQPSGPINTAPVFLGAADKNVASGLVGAAAILALFL